MTVWSDNSWWNTYHDVRGVVKPFQTNKIQPASIDLTLHHKVKFVDPKKISNSVDLEHPNFGEAFYEIDFLDTWHLMPGEFAIASTEEVVNIPTDCVGFLFGKSTLARCGLSVHQTAGLIDPGFTGQLTLELFNAGPFMLQFRTGMDIAQLVMMQLDSTCSVPYGIKHSRYQGQRGPTLP